MIFTSDHAARLYFESTYKYRCMPLDANGVHLKRHDETTSGMSRLDRYEKMTEWCEEQFGPCLHQNHHQDNISIETGRYITQIEINETSRWSAGYAYFCFAHPDDQFAFKMRWPCKVWVHEVGDCDYAKNILNITR